MKSSLVPKDRLLGLFAILLVFQLITLLTALFLSARLPEPGQIDKQFADIFVKPGEFGPPENTSHLEQLLLEEQSVTTAVEPSLVNYIIKRGDTLSKIWALNGAPRQGAIRAGAAFKEAGIATSSLRSGEEIELALSISGDVVQLTRKLDDGRVLILKGNSVDGYQAEVLEADILEKERSVSGVILSSFSASASESSIPYEVVDEFVDLFSNRLEFRRDLKPGDSFTLTYLERLCRRSGRALSPGPIVNASLKITTNFLASIGHKDKTGHFQYYDERGKAIGDSFLRYPLKFTRISSAFSYSRFHPVLKIRRPHNGVDFAAPIGTPVRSIADGIVVDAGYRGGAGNLVKIKHNGQYSSAYLHLARIAAGLKKGSRIARGQTLGTVGMSGLATGPHLHFSLFDNGRYIDPMKAKLPYIGHKEVLPKRILTATLTDLERKHAVVMLARPANLVVENQG